MTVGIIKSDLEWVSLLESPGPDREQALSRLRRVLLRALRTALGRYSNVKESHREDFVQEALIKILNGLHSFRGDSRFLTWATKIAIRVAFSEMRRHRWKDVSLDEMLELTTNRPGIARTRPAQEPQMLSDQIMAFLHEAIRNELSEQQRQVVIAYFIQGIPLDEIARRLGKTRNHLYKIKFDARNRLREALLARGVSVSDVEFAFQG